MNCVQQIGFAASVFAHETMDVPCKVHPRLRIVLEIQQMKFFKAHEGYLLDLVRMLVGN